MWEALGRGANRISIFKLYALKQIALIKERKTMTNALHLNNSLGAQIGYMGLFGNSV